MFIKRENMYVDTYLQKLRVKTKKYLIIMRNIHLYLRKL